MTYTSREHDKESGLYYYRARYYEPALGQFLTADPHPGIAEMPKSHGSKYVYALNDPIGRFDPTGELSLKGLLEVAIGSVLLGPLGSFMAFNMSDEFSDDEKRIGNFIIAVAFNVAMGPGFAATNVAFAITEPGNFVDNFNRNSIGSFGTEGVKGFVPFFTDLVNSNPVRAAYLLYHFDKNDETINRRTDRVCRALTFNECPL